MEMHIVDRALLVHDVHARPYLYQLEAGLFQTFFSRLNGMERCRAIVISPQRLLA